MQIVLIKTMNNLISNDNLEIIKNRYYFTKKFIKNKKILEIGCGFGIGFEYLKKDCKSYEGIDYNKKHIYLAKKNNYSNQSKFRVLNFSQLHLLKKKYDVIICLATIYYLDFNHFLRVCKKHLNKNGVVIFDTSNKNILGFDGSWDKQTKYYQVPELNNLLRKQGFAVKIFGAHPHEKSNVILIKYKIRLFIKEFLKLLNMFFLKNFLTFVFDRKFIEMPNSINIQMKKYKYKYQYVSPVKKNYNFRVILVAATIQNGN